MEVAAVAGPGDLKIECEPQFWSIPRVLPRRWVSALRTFHSRINSLEERANEIEEGPQEVDEN